MSNILCLRLVSGICLFFATVACNSRGHSIYTPGPMYNPANDPAMSHFIGLCKKTGIMDASVTPDMESLLVALDMEQLLCNYDNYNSFDNPFLAALVHAMNARCVEVVRLLVSQSGSYANIKIVLDDWEPTTVKGTFLHMLANNMTASDAFQHRQRDLEILKCLIEYGANPKFKDSFGDTILHTFAYHGDDKAIHTLLDLYDEQTRVSLLEAQNNDEDTPETLALKYKEYPTALLLKYMHHNAFLTDLIHRDGQTDGRKSNNLNFETCERLIAETCQNYEAYMQGYFGKSFHQLEDDRLVDTARYILNRTRGLSIWLELLEAQEKRKQEILAKKQQRIKPKRKEDDKPPATCSLFEKGHYTVANLLSSSFDLKPNPRFGRSIGKKMSNPGVRKMFCKKRRNCL